MHTLHAVSTGLLAAFLLYAGCKGQERLASTYHHDASAEEAESLQVAGEWVVDSLSFPSVAVPSFCYRIGEGAIFEFTENDSLKIYEKDASKPCDTFSYATQSGFFHVVKEDMIMLAAYKLTTERKLVLHSKSLFRWHENNASDSLTYRALTEEGITVFLSKK